MIPFHSLSPAILLLLFCTDARHRLISHAQTHATMSRGECLDQQKFCSGATIKACGETDEPGAPPPPRRKACSCCCWPAASSTGGGGESRLNSALACNTSLARVINSRVRSACNAACPRVLCTRKAAAGFEMRAVRQIQPSGRRPVTCG